MSSPPAPEESPAAPTDKQQSILDFVNLFAAGPQQGSDSWLEARRYTIGGSEMATIVGANRFSSLADLIRGKVLGLRLSDIKMNWGKLFEPVVAAMVERQYGCKIYGENMFIAQPESPQSYSPDGLALIDGKVTLLEFKCPFNRLIKTGYLPDYYMPQILAGLCTIAPLTERALYCEAMIRLCSLGDLDFNPRYNKALWPGDLKNTLYTPSLIGCLLLDCAASASASSPRDWGAYVTAYTAQEFVDFVAQVVAAGTEPQFMLAGSAEELSALLEQIPGTKAAPAVHVLPFKILNTQSLFVEPKPDYLAEHLPLIKATTSEIKRLRLLHEAGVPVDSAILEAASQLTSQFLAGPEAETAAPPLGNNDAVIRTPSRVEAMRKRIAEAAAKRL